MLALTITLISLTNWFLLPNMPPMAATYCLPGKQTVCFFHFSTTAAAFHHQPFFFMKLLILNYCQCSLLSHLIFTEQGLRVYGVKGTYVIKLLIDECFMLQ